MALLRNLVRWVSRHRIASSSLLMAVLALALGANVAIQRSSGTLTPPIEKGNIVEAVYGIGTVTAAHSHSIKPGVIASLTDVYVKEGDFVSKGAKLLKIDTSVYTAPFDGVVNYAPFKVGENVFPQLPALVLTNLAERYLVVTLEQQGALRVRPGQRARLSFDSLRQSTFEGSVKSVYSYNGNFLARIDIAGLPAEILPDMTADVAIIIRDIKDALIIPTVAYDNGAVWVKRGRALPYRVPVQLGVVDGAKAEVLSGSVQTGDRLMVRRKTSS